MTRTHHPEPLSASPSWTKSSYSEGSGNACVEVALSPPSVRVRDSKDTSLPILVLSSGAWTGFLRTLAS
ncbi:DUF397 domain-containing protein [Streptomyces sp. NBC_00838]|uniref:DUF397 domain-containing protein n=1 Tax=Streptomyces sp. NBC_00838 TaxID=2903680 RepID=UPI00386E55A2|nr:DUF397 domain-containing protein [Streptomyces sp. NBC_00838]